ncbi:MAG: hypothetical protein A3F09_01875 [Chlamydiae bacterium RIFCSPHIGHO2_12_FULL_49_11]|nr:MAG: hypothetical protein A3F09_01875 [Chlamydiae bacterium RIFCSPHIGHO2_12_FULL_49_11]
MFDFIKSFAKKKFDYKMVVWIVMAVIFLSYLILHGLDMRSSVEWYGSFFMYFYLFAFAYRWFFFFLESKKKQELALSLLFFSVFVFTFAHYLFNLSFGFIVLMLK